jgi:hypothetical protein
MNKAANDGRKILFSLIKYPSTHFREVEAFTGDGADMRGWETMRATASIAGKFP